VRYTDAQTTWWSHKPTFIIFFVYEESRPKSDRKYTQFYYLLLGSHESDKKVNSVYQLNGFEILSTSFLQIKAFYLGSITTYKLPLAIGLLVSGFPFEIL
jgi:hypothetical protein